jgi:hypothetical protein
VKRVASGVQSFINLECIEEIKFCGNSECYINFLNGGRIYVESRMGGDLSESFFLFITTSTILWDNFLEDFYKEEA